MVKRLLIGAFILLTGCTRNYEGIPPPFYCEDLEEFGCTASIEDPDHLTPDEKGLPVTPSDNTPG